MITPILGMSGLGVSQLVTCKPARPRPDQRPIAGKGLKQPEGVLVQIRIEKDLRIVERYDSPVFLVEYVSQGL